MLSTILSKIKTKFLVYHGIYLSNNYYNYHGFHPLFYYQRTRGNAITIKTKSSNIIISYRDDVKKLTIVRPLGNIKEILQVITFLKKEMPNTQIYCRYLNKEQYEYIKEHCIISQDIIWSKNSLYDDETYSQISLHIQNTVSLEGNNLRWIRQAVKRHNNSIIHKCVKKEDVDITKLLDFAYNNFPKSVTDNMDNRNETNSFFTSTFLGVETFPENLDFHCFYNLNKDLIGFSIVSSFKEVADVYFFTHQRISRLANFQLFKIMHFYDRKKVRHLNLGGSETRSMHNFKKNISPYYQSIKSYLVKL